MGQIFITSAEGVSRTIQLILAPVVMISACAILAGGLVARAAAINDRLRTMARERLELLKTMSLAGLNNERLRELDAQFPDLLHRLRLSHRAVMAVYSAILVYILDMLLIATAALISATWAAWAALLIFLVATIVLGLAISWTVQEVRYSLNAIFYEVARISELAPTDTLFSQEVNYDYKSAIK